MSRAAVPCGTTLLVCLVSYLLAKLATYGFLAERGTSSSAVIVPHNAEQFAHKVRAVCDAQLVVSRWRSRTLQVSAGLGLVVVAVDTLLVVRILIYFN